MTYDRELAQRIRTTLGGRSSVREVKMFGGLSFLINERMVVGVMSDGDLLVRVDPNRAEELLQLAGASPAEMGAGRAMGKGWISVGAQAIATDEALEHWIAVALEYKDQLGRER